MPDITPDLVAQVASKLYNRIPGEQAGLPGNSTGSRCIAATLFERAQQETSAIPGGPLTATSVADNVTSTPLGTSTGYLAIRDMIAAP